METISRIFMISVFWFILINCCFFVIYGDASGFLTTIEFDDKLIDVTTWMVDKGLDKVVSVLR